MLRRRLRFKAGDSLTNSTWLEGSGGVGSNSSGGATAAELAGAELIDCRGEWTDEDFVAVNAPELDYRYVGTDDDGRGQDDEWFEAGVTHFEDLALRGGRVVVHCHMGINRGPSMAFAILLSQGWGITEALDAIASARPIVGLIYADDAVRWWGRRNGWTRAQIADGVAEVSRWQTENGIDVSQVIRVIRQAARKERS